jgi:hypothetical protein
MPHADALPYHWDALMSRQACTRTLDSQSSHTVHRNSDWHKTARQGVLASERIHRCLRAAQRELCKVFPAWDVAAAIAAGHPRGPAKQAMLIAPSVHAGAGECTKNVPFMVGSKSAIGMCRLACKACIPCAAGDTACSKKMRLDQGYMQDVDAEITSIFGPADTVAQTL